MKRIQIPNFLFFASIGFIVDCIAFGAVQSEIFADNSILHATKLDLGILGAIGSLGYAVPAFFMGRLSEHVGRRPIASIGLIGMFFSFMLAPHAVQVSDMLWVSTLRAISTACLWPPIMAWMANVVHPARFPKFISWYNVAWTTGVLVGFFVAGVVFDEFGWKTPFYMAAAGAFVMLVFIQVCTPSGYRHEDGIATATQPPPPPLPVLSSAQRFYYMKQGLLMLGAGCLAANLVLYIFPKVALNLDVRAISLLNSIRIAGQMFIFFLLGRYPKWHFRSWPVLFCFFILVFGTALASFGTSFLLYAIGFFAIGIGFGMGFMMSAYYVLGLITKKGHGSSMMECMVGTSAFAGPLYGGTIAQYTSARIGVFSGLLPVLAITIAALWKRPGSYKGTSTQEVNSEHDK